MRQICVTFGVSRLRTRENQTLEAENLPHSVGAADSWYSWGSLGSIALSDALHR